MQEAKVLVARHENVVAIRVVGRATFKIASELRTFAERAFSEGVTNIVVDLSECVSMDSTFMGVLAMMGLKGRKRANLVLVNANASHRDLLDGIGVSLVWRYADEAVPEVSWETLCEAAAGAVESADVGQTILEAHQSLMELDPANVPRFKSVVEMVSNELGKSRSNRTGDTEG